MELTYAYAMKKPVYALTTDEEITKDILFDGYASTPKELMKYID
jgi:nucleoside 2-deoxyribosyltransferase